MIGDWALFAALPFFIYKLTGSVLATGGMFMIQVVPPLVFGSIAGVYVDRWDHRWTMIGSSLFRGVVLLLLLGVRSADLVWLVYLTGFLESTASQFFNPANNALLPKLVGEEQLISANSLDSLGENSARLIGPAIGGVILASIGLQAVVIIDIFSYLLAALLMFFIRFTVLDSDLTDQTSEPAGHSISGIWREFTAGIKLVARTPPLSRIFLIIAIAFLGDSILTVLFVAFFQDVVGVGSAEFGMSLTVRGLSGILGGVIVGAIGTKFKPNHLISFGLIGTGIGLVAMVFWPKYLITLLILILLSVPLMSWLISSRTWIQSHAPDGFRGRVFGFLETFSALLMFIGMGFASGLGETLGISTTLYISGGIYLFSGILAAILLEKIGEASDISQGTISP
jgi:predicted MFS family arabinose efflux permease